MEVQLKWSKQRCIIFQSSEVVLCEEQAGMKGIIQNIVCLSVLTCPLLAQQISELFE